MANSNVTYSSKINGETTLFKTIGTLVQGKDAVKLTFLSQDNSQEFSFIVFDDCSCLLKCSGGAKYQVKFKNNLEYPFTVSFGAFCMSASAKTNSIISKFSTNYLELNIDYTFTLNGEVDRRAIVLKAEVF